MSGGGAMTAPLYEIAAAYRELAALAEDGADVETALAALTDSLEAKVANIGALLRNLGAECETLAAEEKRLAARRKARENAREDLVEYVRRNMEAAGIKRIKAPRWTFTLVPSDSVVVDDEAALPAAYKREIPATTAPDKRAILAAYRQQGEVVPGARIVTNNHLLVK